MNSAFQSSSNVGKLRRLSIIPRVRVRGIIFLRAAVVLMFVISFFCGCTKESEEIAKLREENRALKEKVAALEGQKPPAVPPKSEMQKEVLAFARKLKSSPNDFVGQQIKLHGRFGGFENKFLDDANGPKFHSSYYVELIFQNGIEINEPIFERLFLSKKEAKVQGVYQLHINDLITVYGVVNSAYNMEPWIEVYVIKKRWE